MGREGGGYRGTYWYIHFVFSFSTSSCLEHRQPFHHLLPRSKAATCDAKGDKNVLRMAGGKTQGVPLSPGIMEPLYPTQISDFWASHSVRKKIKPPICLSCCFQVSVIQNQTEFSTNIRHVPIEIQAKDANRQFNKQTKANVM